MIRKNFAHDRHRGATAKKIPATPLCLSYYADRKGERYVAKTVLYIQGSLMKMIENACKFQYIYGPVPSWRLGSSLGIDLLSQRKKICSYDCLYCQLGKTKKTTHIRQLYLAEDDIIRELNMLPTDISINYLTISGRGEPTLAQNLGSIINLLKKTRQEQVAVITNASIMDRGDVQEELAGADLVIVKLDACSQASLSEINKPHPAIRFENIFEGIKIFRKLFSGKMALQIMFMQANVDYAHTIAEITKEILPDEVQINTPLRPCAVDPLGRDELNRIKGFFSGFNTISVYESAKGYTRPISDSDTLKRRGKIL